MYERFYAKFKRHTPDMSEKQILSQYLDNPSYNVYQPAEDSVYVFEQGKLRLMEANNEAVQKLRRHHHLIKLANAVFMYCVVRNIQKGRPFRTCFWMMPNLLLSYANYMNYTTLNRLVSRIDLHEEGRFVDIYFISGRQLLYQDISSLTTLDPEELEVFTKESPPWLQCGYHPISLEDLKLSE